ncbi:hypothetical protein CPAV1605_412 [seawater metagenome]|uniref:Uncharacterized protein n=1 Tax=seawater metagenome TaxID=1561972 RepID=A0A5E8CHZ3_9ZZZZ
MNEDNHFIVDKFDFDKIVIIKEKLKQYDIVILRNSLSNDIQKIGENIGKLVENYRDDKEKYLLKKITYNNSSNTIFHTDGQHFLYPVEYGIMKYTCLPINTGTIFINNSNFLNYIKKTNFILYQKLSKLWSCHNIYTKSNTKIHSIYHPIIFLYKNKECINYEFQINNTEIINFNKTYQFYYYNSDCNQFTLLNESELDYIIQEIEKLLEKYNSNNSFNKIKEGDIVIYNNLTLMHKEPQYFLNTRREIERILIYSSNLKKSLYGKYSFIVS